MNKNKGYARVEFLASLTRIKDLTAKGHTKKNIYDQLHGEGKITMTYIHFCRFNLSGNISKKDDFAPGVPNTRTVSALLPAIPAENSGDGSITQQPNSNSKFIHEKNVTEKEITEKLVG